MAPVVISVWVLFQLLAFIYTQGSPGAEPSGLLRLISVVTSSHSGVSAGVGFAREAFPALWEMFIWDFWFFADPAWLNTVRIVVFIPVSIAAMSMLISRLGTTGTIIAGGIAGLAAGVSALLNALGLG